jgi:hypothetical protein
MVHLPMIYFLMVLFLFMSFTKSAFSDSELIMGLIPFEKLENINLYRNLFGNRVENELKNK